MWVWADGGSPHRDYGYVQFWPSTLEMEAMFPAPKAKAGEARQTTMMSPTRRPCDLKLNMLACSLLQVLGQVPERGSWE